MVADVRRHRPLANSSGTVDYSVHCTELHRLNMTLMALVSADRRAMSKPLTIASSEKSRRRVMRGARSTFLSSSKLKQSGYCSKHIWTWTAFPVHTAVQPSRRAAAVQEWLVSQVRHVADAACCLHACTCHAMPFITLKHPCHFNHVCA